MIKNELFWGEFGGADEERGWVGGRRGAKLKMTTWEKK